MKNVNSISDPFRHAIDLTTKTIDRRTFHFRNTIIAVVVIALAAVISALVLRSWKPLTGFFLLPTVIGFFIVADTVIVGYWRRTVTGYWAQGRLEFPLFVQTIGMMKALPKATIEGMLRLLPQQCSFVTAEQVKLRGALGNTDAAIVNTQLLHVVRSVAVGAAVPVSLGICLVMFSPVPLWGAAVLPPLFVAVMLFERSIWGKWRQEVKTAVAEGAFGRDVFCKAAAFLVWDFEKPGFAARRLRSLERS